MNARIRALLRDAGVDPDYPPYIGSVPCIQCGEDVVPPEAPLDDAILAWTEHFAWDHASSVATNVLRSVGARP